MGSPSPGATKLLKKETSTMMAVPHRRSPSVTSSCISLEIGDQDVQSPAKSNGLGKSSVTTTSSPRTPAGVPTEKSISPAAKKKRRSSIGGADDIARGLDFSPTASSVEEKKHAFLAKGGGIRKSATQTNSLVKKTITTSPGKEKLVGSAMSASVLSPRKFSDASKKEMISPRGSGLASEGVNISGISNSNSELGANGGSDLVAEEVTSKKSSPRGSLDGKIKKSSPARPSLKHRSDSASTKGRANSNADQVAGDSPGTTPGEVAKSEKSFLRSSLDGKMRKSTPSPSSKPKSDLTSSKGSKVKRNLQDIPSTQPGRVRKQAEKAVRKEELSKPEVQSVKVPFYSENECQNAAKPENISDTSQLVPAPLLHSEANEDSGSRLLDGNVGDEDINSLDHPGGEPDFDNDNELHTSWLLEDLPCTFSSLSHLPEPDDSGSSLLNDPPEVLSEPFLREAVSNQKPSDESLPAIQIDITAEMPPGISASSAGSPIITLVSDPLIEDHCPREYSGRIDKPRGDSESSTLHMDEDQVKDPFEAELRPQIDVFAHEHELEQASVPPPVEEYVDVPMTLLTHESEIMTYKFMADLEDISSSTSDNEDSFGSECVAHEAPFNNVQVTDNLPTVSAVAGEGNLNILLSAGEGCPEQPVLHQITEDFTSEDCQMALKSLEDEEIYQLNESPTPINMSASDSRPASQQDKLEKDEVSTICSTPSMYDIESSDDEYLEEIIEDAQLNLKQSFDDVAEPLEESKSEVDDVCVPNPFKIPTNTPATVDAKKDTSGTTSNGMTDSRDLASHVEDQILPDLSYLSESTLVAEESLDVQVYGTSTPTDLDQDTKTLKEFWAQTVTDESSKTEAGQNDAEDLQLNNMSQTQLMNEGLVETEKSSTPIEMPVSIFPIVDNLKLTAGDSIESEPSGQPSPHLCVSKEEIMDVLKERGSLRESESLASSSYPDSLVSLPDLENYQSDIVSVGQEEASPLESAEVVNLVEGVEDMRKSTVMGNSLSLNSSSSQLPEYIQHQKPLNPVLSHYLNETSLRTNSSESDAGPEMVTTLPKSIEYVHVVETRQEETSVREEPTSAISALSSPVTVGAKPSLGDSNARVVEGSIDQVATLQDFYSAPSLIAISKRPLDDNFYKPLDDGGSFDVDSVTSEIPQQDPRFASTMQDAPLENIEISFELDANLKVENGEDLNPGMDTPCMLQELEVYGGSSKTTGAGDVDLETQIDHSKEVILEEGLLETCNHRSSNGDFEEAGKAEGSDDHDLEISSELVWVNSAQDSLVSSQINASDSGVMKLVDPLESTALKILLPPCMSEEESTTEDNAVLSLSKKEESYNGAREDVGHVENASSLIERQEMIENSVVDHELQRNLGQEVPQVDLLDAIKQDEFSGYISEDDSMSNSIDEFAESTALSCPVAAENGAVATLTDIASLAEIGHNAISIASGPTLLCLEELPNKSLREVGELDTLDVECNVEEDKSSNGVRIVNFEEMSREEQVLEELLPATEKGGSKSIIEDERDLVSEEPMIVNASDSVEDDENGSVEDPPKIDVEKIEETTSSFSITASTVSNATDKHSQVLQENHLSAGTSTSIDDCDSKTELDPEAEKVLMAPFDAAYDEIFSDVASDDGTITDEESITENSSVQDVPLKLSVVSDPDISNAAIVEVGVEESEFAWQAENEEQSSYRTLEEKYPFGNEIVFDSLEESFVASGHNSKWTIVDDREEQSTLSRTADKEEDISKSGLEKKAVLENEETVVHISKNSVEVPYQADTHNTISFRADDVLNHSNTPCEVKAEDDEVSLNESSKLKESALLDEDDLVINSTEELVDVVIEHTSDTINHSNFSWKADAERDGLDDSLEKDLPLKDEKTVVDSTTNSLVNSAGLNNATSVEEMEKLSDFSLDMFDKDGSNSHQILEEVYLLEDENTILDSPKKLLTVSGDNSKWLEGEIQVLSQFSGQTEMERGILTGKLEEPALEGEDLMVYSPQIPFDATVQGTPVTTNLRCTEVENDTNVSSQAEKEVENLSEDVEGELLLEDEDTVVYRSSENTPYPGLVSAEKMEKQLVSFEKATKDESSNESTMEERRLEVKETTVNSPIDQSSVVPEPNIEHAASSDFDVVKEHGALKDVGKGECINENLEEISVLDATETMVDSAIECSQVDTANAVRLNVEEAEETRMDNTIEYSQVDTANAMHLNVAEAEETRVDNAIECSQVDTTKAAILHVDNAEDTMVDSAMRCSQIDTANASLINVDKVETMVDREIGSSQLDTANPAILPVDETKEKPIQKIDEDGESLHGNSKEEIIHEDEGMVVNNSSANGDNTVPVVIPNGAIHNCTKDVEEDFENFPKLDCEASAPHESVLENRTEDAGMAENSSVVGTNDKDEDSDEQKCSKTGKIEDSATPEIITNGEHLKENGGYHSDCLHETSSKPETLLLVENTSTTSELMQDAASTSQATHEEEEIHSQEAKLYPLLPFSGSQQDRLWEEQAEAYSSGGRGTPIRNEDAAQSAASSSPSPPGEPTSSDDQIQPAAGPIHNGHGVVSTANESGEDDSPHEPNGNVKGKLHTPLRSLLLEDASKCTADVDPITPNGTTTSSPSFIRRLFRVMSTPSRAGEREGMSQAKLKKSSSMWASCLGSPQAQH